MNAVNKFFFSSLWLAFIPLTTCFGLMSGFAAWENVVPFKRCDDGNSVLNLMVTPCNGRRIDGFPTCVLTHEIDIHVGAFFLSVATSVNPEIVFTATKDNIEIVLPDPGDPCSGSLTPNCPLIEGRVYTFSHFFSVPMSFPTGPVEIKFGIRDPHTGRYGGCVTLPLFIERNPKLKYN